MKKALVMLLLAAMVAACKKNDNQASNTNNNNGNNTHGSPPPGCYISQFTRIQFPYSPLFRKDSIQSTWFYDANYRLSKIGLFELSALFEDTFTFSYNNSNQIIQMSENQDHTLFKVFYNTNGTIFYINIYAFNSDSGKIAFESSALFSYQNSKYPYDISDAGTKNGNNSYGYNPAFDTKGNITTDGYYNYYYDTLNGAFSNSPLVLGYLWNLWIYATGSYFQNGTPAMFGFANPNNVIETKSITTNPNYITKYIITYNSNNYPAKETDSSGVSTYSYNCY